MKLRPSPLLLACTAAIVVAMVPAALSQNAQRAGRFNAEPNTPFEDAFLRRASRISEDETRGPADNNARGLIITEGRWAVLNFSVKGRKYGISIDGTDGVLVKNFRFNDRRSRDIYGSGIVVGSKAGARGESYISNAWIDLGEAGPVPDYKKANNEGISVERGNAPVNIRRAVLIGSQESGIDNKGDVRMDAAFIASGHQSVRVWSGGSLTIANSTILAVPGYSGLWLGGGKAPARFSYYNCRFGRVGDRPEELTSDPPAWMISIEDESDDVRITRLRNDPFDRGNDSFWQSVETPIPPGYLSGR